jgi:hypothetical protein
MRFFLFSLLIAAGLVAAFPRLAAAADDPPGRVARLNYIQGSVSFQAAGENDWVEANPNRPLTTSDNLWADKDSRGEVHIGSTSIRLSSETGISFLNLDDRTVQIQLAQGLIEVHLRHLSGGDAFEIDTPNLAFTLTRAGEYKIETDPNGGSTVITVREGEGQVTGGGENYDLGAGEQYTFTGTDQLSYDAAEAPAYDEFEDWCQTRDQRENQSQSARYVSRDVDGYYDLDENGDWVTDPEYGSIWVPQRVVAGWVPYHFGQWVYIAPWGWTWVDDEPWGFAPFHYGRWAFVRGYWGWVPGPMVVRPVYAPALVAFVGGGGFSLSVSFGGGFAGVAWFPLGPRDVYVPGYRCSPRYVQNINITNTRVVNVTQITNVYNTYNVSNMNRNVMVTRVNYMYANNAAAVTAVSKETFVNARPVARESVRVTPQQMENVRVVESAPLAPTRSSYVAATARPTNAKPSIPLGQRTVVVKLNPAASVNTGRSREYTNESEPFSQQGQARTNNAQEPAKNNGGFRPFKPPSGSQGNNPSPAEHNNTFNKPAEQQQLHQSPPVKFSPPVKAKDEMYDVHPPLNKKSGATPGQEERKSEPAPKPEPKKEQHPEPHPHQ